MADRAGGNLHSSATVGSHAQLVCYVVVNCKGHDGIVLALASLATVDQLVVREQTLSDHEGGRLVEKKFLHIFWGFAVGSGEELGVPRYEASDEPIGETHAHDALVGSSGVESDTCHFWVDCCTIALLHRPR